MEKYKKVMSVGVTTFERKEKQVMTKEYALSLQHSRRSSLKGKDLHVRQCAVVKASKRRKFVDAFVKDFPNKEIPKALPKRFGGYRN